MDDIEMCGNDLHFLLWWLKGPGPRSSETIHNLAEISQALVKIVASSQIKNAALAGEIRSESGKALMAATREFAGTGAARVA
jgi:hypothetical protein